MKLGSLCSRIVPGALFLRKLNNNSVLQRLGKIEIDNTKRVLKTTTR